MKEKDIEKKLKELETNRMSDIKIFNNRIKLLEKNIQSLINDKKYDDIIRTKLTKTYDNEINKLYNYCDNLNKKIETLENQ